jgi:hypothetical protein
MVLSSRDKIKTIFITTYAQDTGVLVGPATLVGPEGAGRCSMFNAINDLAEKTLHETKGWLELIDKFRNLLISCIPT